MGFRHCLSVSLGLQLLNNTWGDNDVILWKVVVVAILWRRMYFDDIYPPVVECGISTSIVNYIMFLHYRPLSHCMGREGGSTASDKGCLPENFFPHFTEAFVFTEFPYNMATLWRHCVICVPCIKIQAIYVSRYTVYIHIPQKTEMRVENDCLICMRFLTALWLKSVRSLIRPESINHRL